MYLDTRCTFHRYSGHSYVPPIAKNSGPVEKSNYSAFVLQELSVIGAQQFKVSKLISSMKESYGKFSLKSFKNSLSLWNTQQERIGFVSYMSSADAVIEFRNGKWQLKYCSTCALFDRITIFLLSTVLHNTYSLFAVSYACSSLLIEETIIE